MSTLSEVARPAYELYLLRMSQKWRFNVPHDRQQPLKSSEKQSFNFLESSFQCW